MRFRQAAPLAGLAIGASMLGASAYRHDIAALWWTFGFAVGALTACVMVAVWDKSYR